MRCEAKPEDLPPAVAHDQEPVQQPERDRRDYEQVARCRLRENMALSCGSSKAQMINHLP